VFARGCIDRACRCCAGLPMDCSVRRWSGRRPGGVPGRRCGRL